MIKALFVEPEWRLLIVEQESHKEVLFASAFMYYWKSFSSLIGQADLLSNDRLRFSVNE